MFNWFLTEMVCTCCDRTLGVDASVPKKTWFKNALNKNFCNTHHTLTIFCYACNLNRYSIKHSFIHCCTITFSLHEGVCPDKSGACLLETGRGGGGGLLGQAQAVNLCSTVFVCDHMHHQEGSTLHQPLDTNFIYRYSLSHKHTQFCVLAAV